jgi:cell shape-determining protein MreC
MQTSRVQRQISKLIDVYSEGLIEKKESEPRIRYARAQLEKLQAETRSQEQLQAQLQEIRQVIGHEPQSETLQPAGQFRNVRQRQ